MDASTFDRLVADASRRRTRRAALRLLASGLLGGLLAQRGVPARARQRPDRDGDGLFDDDETSVYGTNPDAFDTDGDGTGDGEEVYNRDNGFAGPNDPLTPDGAAAPPPPTPPPPPAPTCSSLGARCNADAECCQGALCCFNGTTLASHCTDVSGIGFACPGDAPPAAGCPPGQTACGSSCVDLITHAGHCGACYHSCPLGGHCQGGRCTGVICMDGLTNCGGFCTNLMTDPNNCGRCGGACFIPLIGDPECVNGVCD
jgi:hypothetical protein